MCRFFDSLLPPVHPRRLTLCLTIGLNKVTTSRNGDMVSVRFSCDLRIFLVLFTPLGVKKVAQRITELMVHGDIVAIPHAEFAVSF